MNASEENNILIGNGFDIQLGGDDFLNKWIIVRLLTRAASNDYDELFADKHGIPSIAGDEIVSLFNGLVNIANDIRDGNYDSYAQSANDNDLDEALLDFKNRYTHTIATTEEIGMEDWILIIQLYLLSQTDLSNTYEPVKQGIQRMLLDAIYCDGNIQRININKSVIEYFRAFDHVFTVNYDNSLEKRLKTIPVYHLHGDYQTKSMSEDEHTANGYLRIQKDESIFFSKKFSHCNCNAILDFSGRRKYQLAQGATTAYLEFEKIKQRISNGTNNVEEIIHSLPLPQQEIIRVGVEHDLSIGCNYHFNDLQNLSGTLTIIGLAPQNDSHIFECIDSSMISKVIFYHYFGNQAKDDIEKQVRKFTIPIKKPYEVRNVDELWNTLKISKPQNSTTYMRITPGKGQKFLSLFNLFYTQQVSYQDVILQLRSIPAKTEQMIFSMMQHELQKDKYHQSPESEKELMQLFSGFGKTLKIASISPQALYCLYFAVLNERKTVHGKKLKR